jgi:hypothetical protein
LSQTGSLPSRVGGTFLSVGLFVAACCLPALEFKNSDKPNDVMLGLRALAVGWSGIFAGVIAWYANPFLALSLVLAAIRKPVMAGVAALIVVGIALTVFSDIGRELPGDEGGVTKTTLIRVLPGFYVLIGSMVTAGVAGFIRKRQVGDLPY